MATFDLGRVTPIYKGDYSASASYELNDVVLYNGNLYWHVKATATVGILPTDTTVWKLAFADGGVRTEIRGYADDAQASAEAASASATSASTSATSAQSSATSASQSATQASTSATNASASASLAQEYAEQAEESAAALSDINERLDEQGQTIDSIEEKTTATSENVLDQSALTVGRWLKPAGNTGLGASYAYTDFIKVEEGDVIRGYADKQSVLGLRYVCAYDDKQVVVSAAGAENALSYTVPSGIAYVRITGYVRPDNSGINGPLARIFRNGADEKYQTYKSGDVTDFATKNYAATQILKNYPLTTITPYMLNLLSYRPLGTLTKGYICLVSDDGDAELETYTIPMLQNKGDVPCTFAVMNSSAVFTAQTGIDAVVDAVTNHGCNIAQHGVTRWDEYDELTLNGFFDKEKAYWDSLGLTPYGAVCPAHNINNLVRAICGGRFGCLRTGYANGIPCYPNYTNGPKSNVFGLTSHSSLDGTLATQKASLDYAKANNMLKIIHWHDNELTAEKKTVLEGIIDYAQQIGLTFITMKEIPNII